MKSLLMSKLWNLVESTFQQMFCFISNNFESVTKQCLKTTFLTHPIFSAGFKKKTLSPHHGWRTNSVAMDFLSRFKSLIVCNQTEKKCWALSLSSALPEAAGSQDPQVFTLTDPCWISPLSPGDWPASLLLFSTSADPIRRSLWNVSTVFTKLW